MSWTDAMDHEAVAAARGARETAELELQASKLRRADAARALEYDVYPMTIDEAERARRRQAVAVADAEVASRRDAVRRARMIEDAALALVAAVTGTNQSEKAAAASVMDILGGRAAPAPVSRSLAEPASVRRAPRAVRRPGSRPLPA